MRVRFRGQSIRYREFMKEGSKLIMKSEIFSWNYSKWNIDKALLKTNLIKS